jgi:hypothetical protein
MRVLSCGCQLDKIGRATPCPTARALLDARDATTEPALLAARPEVLRALIDHMVAGGISPRELAVWSDRGARNQRRRPPT